MHAMYRNTEIVNTGVSCTFATYKYYAVATRKLNTYTVKH